MFNTDQHFDRQLHRLARDGVCWSLCAMWLSIVAGCGGQTNMAPVNGVVRLDGKPLTQGIVTFTPKAGRNASGNIESDGSFRLSTIGTGEGALVGVHGVSVVVSTAASGRPNFDTDRPAIAKDSPIPTRYASPDTSGLSFEVKAGESNRAELDLTSK